MDLEKLNPKLVLSGAEGTYNLKPTTPLREALHLNDVVLHISNTAADADKLLNALQRQVSVNMDEQACSEVLAAFSAYYKVSSPRSPASPTLTNFRLRERLSSITYAFK